MPIAAPAASGPSCGPRRPGYLGTLAVVTALVLAVPLLLSQATRGDRPPALSSSRSSPSARRPTWRSRSSTGWSPRSLGSAAAAPARPGRRRADGDANARRRADAAHRRAPMSRRRSAASRSTTSATARATCGSPCCPTGSMPTTEHVARRRRAARHGGGGHRPAQRAPRRGARGRRPLPALPPQATLERRPRAAGWAGSASAASSTS